MTDTQLYLTVGLPMLIAVIGILVNVGYFVVINARITGLELRLDARITALGAKFDTKFDILVGKVIEVGNRLTRLEERWKH